MQILGLISTAGRPPGSLDARFPDSLCIVWIEFPKEVAR
jgi:hypothetical protein